MSSATVGPSTPVALMTFLVGGPLTYVPVLLAFGGNFHALNPVAWMFGATFWLMALGNPELWLTTWIPTALAAIVCAVVLRHLAATRCHVRSPRWIALAVGCIVCGFLSGLVYLCCSRLGIWLAPVHPGQVTPPIDANSLHGDGVRFAMLGYGVPLVAVVGALLGGGLAWWFYPFHRSDNHEK